MIKKIFFIFLFLFSSTFIFAKELSYSKVLKKYHRAGEEYSKENFHALYRWDVLWMSPELREVQNQYLADHYKDSPAELRVREAKSEKIETQATEFLIFFYTYNKKWNELETANSIWKLNLQAGEQTFKPTEIIKIKPDNWDESLYPYFAPCIKMYKVRFPLVNTEQELNLSLYGIKGESHLIWKY